MTYFMNEQNVFFVTRIKKNILSDNDNVGFIKEMIEDVAQMTVDAHRRDERFMLNHK